MEAHCSSLGVPRIPVEVYGVDELHAAFLTESRTRGPVMCSVAGIRGLLGMTKGRVAVARKNCWWEGKQQIPPLRYATVPRHGEAGPDDESSV